MLILCCNTGSFIDRFPFVFKCVVYYLVFKVCDCKKPPEIHAWDIEREPPPRIGM